MSSRPLRWINVRIIKRNTKVLQKLLPNPLEAFKSGYVCYDISDSTYSCCDTVFSDGADIIVPDFSKLPEILLMHSIGMSADDILNSLYEGYKNV